MTHPHPSPRNAYRSEFTRSGGAGAATSVITVKSKTPKAKTRRTKKSFFRRSKKAAAPAVVAVNSRSSPKSKSEMVEKKRRSQSEDADDHVPYPISHLNQSATSASASASFRHSSIRSIEIPKDDDDISIVSAMSVGSASVSSFRLCSPETIPKARTVALVKTPTSLHRHQSLPSPSVSQNMQFVSTPTSLHRSQSQNTPRPAGAAAATHTPLSNLKHLSHLMSPSLTSLHRSQYASHLLQSPTSNGSYSVCTTPSSMRSFQHHHPPASPACSDAGSVASGISVASSYTALSSLSYHDPCGKPSRIMKRSKLRVPEAGDGDIWVEKIFISKRTAKRRTFFVSVATGRRVRDEPPTGASKVLYADDLAELRKIEAAEQESLEQQQQQQYVPVFNLASC